MWPAFLVHIGVMSVSKPQGLLRRGNVWHYRRRVPLDLLKAFDGRRELKESLRTESLGEAKVRRNLVAAKFEALFDEARARANGACALPAPQQSLMREAVRRYVQTEDAKRAEEFAKIDWSSDPEGRDDARHETLELATHYENPSHEATALAVSSAAREIFGESVTHSEIGDTWELQRRGDTFLAAETELVDPSVS